MLKFNLGEKFILNQDVSLSTSTVSINSKKGSILEIIEIDNTDMELPYKVLFEECAEWIFLSEEEIIKLTD